MKIRIFVSHFNLFICANVATQCAHNTCDACWLQIDQQNGVSKKKKGAKKSQSSNGPNNSSAVTNGTSVPKQQNSSSKTAPNTKLVTIDNNQADVKMSTTNSKKVNVGGVAAAAAATTPTASQQQTINKTNLATNQASSKPTQIASATTAAAAAAAASSKPAKKVNKTSEMLEPIPTAVLNKNLDDVLKTVRQLDNTCDFNRCPKKTSLIGQDCTLCKQRFCMKHQLPEVHGCGGAIKKTERKLPHAYYIYPHMLNNDALLHCF